MPEFIESNNIGMPLISSETYIEKELREAKTQSRKDKKEKKDTSIKVFQRESIKFSFDISELPWTENQLALINLINDKKSKVIFVKGPAGTAKSIIATYCGLKLLLQNRIKEIFYVRNPVESSSTSLGFLPGSLNEKITPYLQPLYDKVHELLPKKEDMDKIMKDSRVTPLPLGFMRGLSINASYIYMDESQNFEVKDFLTCMTRLGRFSKLVICGDTRQSDIKHSGFEQVYKLFDNEESKNHGIYNFKFGIDDIMRDESLKYIIEKFEVLSK